MLASFRRLSFSPRSLPHLWPRLSTIRSYATRQKHLNSGLHGTPPKSKRPAHVGPREWRRTQKLVAEQEQLTQGDSPEVRASKRRLLGLTTNSRTNLDAVDQVAADCRTLHGENIPLSSTAVLQILGWCTRALIYMDGQLLRQKLPIQRATAAFQQTRSALQSVVEGFITQYKHGVYNVNASVPSLVLSYYNQVGDFEKALKLWNWLCSVGEKGHQGWQMYAARIDIEHSISGSYDACQELFDEALNKLGNPLVGYHISDNAVLPDVTQPAPRESANVIPLLKRMFSIRMKHGYWREALLTLDTILRLDPMQFGRSTKLEILGAHTSWEAFLSESLEVESGNINSSRSSVVIPWLSQLVAPLKLSQYDQKTALRLHSVACTILESLKTRYQAHLISTKGRNDSLDSPPFRGDFADLKLLWTCWSTLYHWRGRDMDLQQNEPVHASDMAEFIVRMLKELRCSESASFQAYMGHDVNAIAKLNGDFGTQQAVSPLLLDLRQRFEQVIKSEDMAATVTDYRTIPYWSDLFSRDEMLSLYQELDPIGQASTDRKTENSASSYQPEDQEDMSSPTEFSYETKTGLPFAEARFRSWWIVNNLYLAADAFEQTDCLFPHNLDPKNEAEVAAKQADVLETLNLKNLSGEERTRQKQMLLDYLRDFRRYRGDTAI